MIEIGFMKKVLGILWVVGCMAGGCRTLDGDLDGVEERARAKHETDSMKSEVAALRGRMEELSLAMQDQRRAIDVAGGERGGELQRLNSRLQDLERRIGELDSARQRDRDEIVATLSARVADMLKSRAGQASSPSPSRAVASSAPVEHASKPVPAAAAVASSGEHTVKSGQTLVEIARLYGVTVEEVVKANNITDANAIRAGQRLAIPK